MKKSINDLYSFEKEKSLEKLKIKYEHLKTKNGKREYLDQYKEFLIKEKLIIKEKITENLLNHKYIEQISMLDTLIDKREGEKKFKSIKKFIEKNGFQIIFKNNKFFLILNLKEIKFKDKIEIHNIKYYELEKGFTIDFDKSFELINYNINKIIEKKFNVYIIVLDYEEKEIFQARIA